jgi:hypothetical protein
MTKNLQTLAFIANLDSLFTGHREPLIDIEIQALEDFDSVKTVLEETFSDEVIAAAWEKSDDCNTNERKTLCKAMDISFHQKFKKLHDSFKVVREYYTQIVPEIDAGIYVNSLSSVMSLVDLYSNKTELFRRDQRHVFKNFCQPLIN